MEETALMLQKHKKEKEEDLKWGKAFVHLSLQTDLTKNRLTKAKERRSK